MSAIAPILGHIHQIVRDQNQMISGLPKSVVLAIPRTWHLPPAGFLSSPFLGRFSHDFSCVMLSPNHPSHHFTLVLKSKNLRNTQTDPNRRQRQTSNSRREKFISDISGKIGNGLCMFTLLDLLHYLTPDGLHNLGDRS